MSSLQIAFLTLYAAGMALGQTLFKFAALKLSLAQLVAFA